MKKRFLYLILPIITVVLEILPYGAVLNFMRPSTDGTTVGHFRELYSYFDLTPFGYANFAPLITAVITCIILGLFLVYCVTGKISLVVKARNILCVGTLFSLGPLVFGLSYFSVIGAMITVTLILELMLIQFKIKTYKK